MPGLVDDVVAVEPDSDLTRPSLGQLLAKKGKGAPQSSLLAPRVATRMQKVHPGRFIAYEGEGLRQCRIGKVLNVLEDKSEVSLHVYEARANHKLQIS